MLFRILFCFFYLITTGCSTNKYLFENNRYSQTTTHRVQQPLPYKQQHNQNNAAPITYEKEYLYFSAAEDVAEETEVLNKLLSAIKKRQQVVFIKPVANDAYEAALNNLIENTRTIQEKTHIYVFDKEPNYHDLKEKFQRTQQDKPYKPIVHFVKYRKTSEAQRIQSAIIERYGSGSDNGYAQPQSHLAPTPRSSNNIPVSKNYAMNFLPAGVDVVPGSSYIPLFFLI